MKLIKRQLGYPVQFGALEANSIFTEVIYGILLIGSFYYLGNKIGEIGFLRFIQGFKGARVS